MEFLVDFCDIEGCGFIDSVSMFFFFCGYNFVFVCLFLIIFLCGVVWCGSRFKFMFNLVVIFGVL